MTTQPDILWRRLLLALAIGATLVWATAVACHGAEGTPSSSSASPLIPQPVPLQPMTAPKAIQTPKISSMIASVGLGTSGRGQMKNGPAQVLLISWENVDGANVATVIRTTTNNISLPIDQWDIGYAGKGKSYLQTNEFGHNRWFRGSTTLTNL